MCELWRDEGLLLMKITERSPVIGKVICGNCDTEYEYSKSDITRYLDTDVSNVIGPRGFLGRGRQTQTDISVAYVPCPVCGRRYVISSKVEEVYDVMIPGWSD